MLLRLLRRLIDAVKALGLWGFASSNLTRMWLHSKDDHLSGEMDSLRQQLHAISEQLRHLTDSLIDPQHITTLSTTDAPSAAGDESEYTRV
jgi:hypothetical protein